MTQYQFNNALVEIQERLHFYALRLTADHDKAGDLLQETLLKALSYRDKFRHNTNFSAWIYTIMRNTFINNFRRNARIQKLFLDQTSDALQVSYGDGAYPSPDDLYSSKQITKYIDTLEDDLRIPFVKFLHGYKYKEIAGQMNVSIGTVKSRIFYARKILKGILSEIKTNE